MRRKMELERKVDASCIHFTVTLDVVCPPVAYLLAEKEVMKLVEEFRAKMGERCVRQEDGVPKVVAYYQVREEEQEMTSFSDGIDARLRRGLQGDKSLDGYAKMKVTP